MTSIKGMINEDEIIRQELKDQFKKTLYQRYKYYSHNR